MVLWLKCSMHKYKTLLLNNYNGKTSWLNRGRQAIWVTFLAILEISDMACGKLYAEDFQAEVKQVLYWEHECYFLEAEKYEEIQHWAAGLLSVCCCLAAPILPIWWLRKFWEGSRKCPVYKHKFYSTLLRTSECWGSWAWSLWCLR